MRGRAAGRGIYPEVGDAAGAAPPSRTLSGEFPVISFSITRIVVRTYNCHSHPISCSLLVAFAHSPFPACSSSVRAGCVCVYL